MASLEEKDLEDINPFGAHAENEETSTGSQTHSESSSVGLLLNAMSSLTYNEASSKDHSGFQNLSHPLIQKKLENIQPTTSRVGSASKVSIEQRLHLL